jgi:hypothetical protein
MKITLDIDKLLEDGKIDSNDYKKLKGFAQTDTASLGLNILIGFGVIAVSGGMVALVQSAALASMIGALIGFFGVYLQIRSRGKWNTLGSIALMVGALIFGGGIIVLTEGRLVGFILLAVIYFVIGFAVDSGLMLVLGALSVWSAIGAIAFYDHASYTFGTDKPLLTILIFSILGIGCFFAAKYMDARNSRLLIVLSRVSIFFVNIGFWIGSLWGDDLFSLRDNASIERTPVISDLVFSIAWAIALIVVAIWAARNNFRWTLNLAAVFAAIHFYTQWFERLGATPGTVVIAGIIAIGIAVGLAALNRKKMVDQPETV